MTEVGDDVLRLRLAAPVTRVSVEVLPCPRPTLPIRPVGTRGPTPPGWAGAADRSRPPRTYGTGGAAPAGRPPPPRARPTPLVAPARRAAQRRQPDPAVRALLDTLSRDAFLADLATLAAHPTRRSDSAGFDEAATWAAGTSWRTAGYAVTHPARPAGRREMPERDRRSRRDRRRTA